MSRTSPTAIERVILLAGCRTCFVAPGQWCRLIESHRQASELHVSRGDQMVEAYWMGYQDGKNDERAKRREAVQ